MPEPPPEYMREMLRQRQIELERRLKEDKFHELLHALEESASPLISPNDVGAYLRDRIGYHKKMIEALEWFAAHVSLDKTDNEVVSRVIMAGLHAIQTEERRRREALVGSTTASVKSSSGLSNGFR